MLKTHFRYLQSAVGAAIKSRLSEQIAATLCRKRVPGLPVYGLINDIVSDARFYHVIDADDFWRVYASSEICLFIDSIDPQMWRDGQRLTLHKEDFLNQWLATHMMPMSEQEREQKLRRALRLLHEAGLGEDIKIGGGGYSGIAFGVHDMTGDGGDGTTPAGDANTTPGNSALPAEIQQLARKGHGAGRGAAPPHTAQGEFLRNIDPQLLRLARMIGRSGGEVPRLLTSRFGHGRRSDISGITVGDDLNSLLPSELAMLSCNDTYDIFLRRFTAKRLQIFSSASQSMCRGNGNRGPIIMCVDTSGSMGGEPETMAKTLAMAIAIVAQRDKRPVLVVNYSHQVSFFVLTDLRRQWNRFLAFLAMSYSGGNDENLLFDFVFAQLPSSERYRHLVRDFDGADLLVISDFIWRPVQQETSSLIENAHSRGMRYFALEVGQGRFEELDWEQVPQNGEWFIQLSDHYFVYHKGVLTPKK